MLFFRVGLMGEVGSMSIRTAFFGLAGLMLLWPITPCAADTAEEEAIVLRYPLTSRLDTRLEYFYELLELALDESGVTYTLVPSDLEMNNARQKLSLQSGAISVIWSAAERELEGKLRAVPVPIFAGAMGYRLFIAHKNLKDELEKVSTVEELKKFSIGQGIGWVSTDIFIENGFEVETASYNSLFKMVNYGRIDLYPRGVQEAYLEVKERKSEMENIFVSEDVGVYHPIVVLFYVNNEDHKLYDALLRGMDSLYRNGKFRDYFVNSKVFKSINPYLDFENVTWVNLDNKATPEYLRDASEKYYRMFHLRDAFSDANAN